ncbi:TonB-dependent receptor [Chitinophaga pinensis]|uniref:TonB-dependent receptor n=1 Tax=Chitinophaga pinensis (strain ATCC 43595 / DSM 2588 / LMG 13176 / NBRC 15968 / NCIMB 11800 / UQM 2034) TaxID=485918 RepID=A0A979FZ29_CHIPD|nr:TonB-dependent receptor [Chitinophaga pinensis]ACU57773.1 TonB-dependent receptor [Chitinophaga pinensis DSM 2588]
MKQNKILVLLLFLAFPGQQLFAQERYYRLPVTVRDTSGQSLIGVTVRVNAADNTSKTISGGSTDGEGHFEFRLPKGIYILSLTYIGFQPVSQRINVPSDGEFKLVMRSGGTGLQEVIVRGQSKTNPVKNLEMGVQSINLSTLRKMPALLGEVDVVRSVLSLPGVSSVGEGSSGFNVRGGNVDQNLVLMDGAPVFNTSHLFGLFSVFNPEVVQDVKLIKGGITPDYGGRLSSVMDIKLKSGSPDSLRGAGGIGSVSARLSAGFPILHNKGSVFIAARRTYADQFLKLSSDENLNSTVAYFQDFNGKVDYQLSTKDRISLAGYWGNDKLGLQKDFTIGYDNANAAATYLHEFSSGFSAKTTFLFSQYRSNLGVLQEPQSLLSKQYIRQYALKTDWHYRRNEAIDLTFGLSAIRYDVNPGVQTPLTESSVFNTTTSARQAGNELGFYLNNAHKFSKKLSAQYGIRFSYFGAVAAQNGPVYTYGGMPGKELLPVLTTEFKKGAAIKNYGNVEPRVSLRYLLSESASIKAGYNRMAQYVHLISATTASTPLDAWMISTNNIRPELADQFSLGYFMTKHSYELSAEAYYKTMSNQIDVINGTEPIGNQDVEKDLVYGKGRSYGLELYLKKNTGKLNGFASYTLSKTERQMNGVNNGDWYNAKYDRTHNLNLVVVYNYSNKWTFSSNYVYQTGVAATFPSGRSEFQGIIVPYNNGDLRNNYRYSPYSRLDLSATLFVRHRAGSRFSSNWVFSLYNVLNRKNVYALYFKQDNANPNKTIANQLSVIGSIIPGVTWNFNF